MDNRQIRATLSRSWDNLPDLESVRVFVAVAETGSFRGAALALRVPKSTVSRRVASLEAALSLPLLQRTTRQVTLTDTGEAFLRQVMPALTMLHDAGRAVLDGARTPRGLLRVTATPTMGESMTNPLLSLLEDNPAVRLECDFTDRHIDLVAEAFDLAVRAGALPDSTLRARRLGLGRDGYFASPGYLKAHAPIRTPRDLLEHECIAFSGSSRLAKWRFRTRNKPVEVRIRWRLRANSMVLVSEAAVRGMGVAWLPGVVARDLLTRGALQPVLEQHWPEPVPVQVVYPSARHLAPQVRAALDLLEKALRW